MNQIEVCKRCTNREISRTEGILCGLTHQKPTFENECPDYIADEKQISRFQRFEKEHNPKAVQLESVYKNAGTGLPLFAIGLLLTFGKGINQGIGFLILIGGLCILIGLLFLIYAIIGYTAAAGMEDVQQTQTINPILRRKKQLKNAKGIFIFSLCMIPVAYLLAYFYVKINGGVNFNEANFVTMSAFVIILSIVAAIASGIVWAVLKKQPTPENKAVSEIKKNPTQSDFKKAKNIQPTKSSSSDEFEVY